jgi:hypothetical protein
VQASHDCFVQLVGLAILLFVRSEFDGFMFAADEAAQRSIGVDFAADCTRPSNLCVFCWIFFHCTAFVSATVEQCLCLLLNLLCDLSH